MLCLCHLLTRFLGYLEQLHQGLYWPRNWNLPAASFFPPDHTMTFTPRFYRSQPGASTALSTLVSSASLPVVDISIINSLYNLTTYYFLRDCQLHDKSHYSSICCRMFVCCLNSRPAKEKLFTPEITTGTARYSHRCRSSCQQRRLPSMLLISAALVKKGLLAPVITSTDYMHVHVYV